MEPEIRIIGMVFEFVTLIVAIGCVTGVITSYLKHRRLKNGQSPELMAKLDELSDRLARLDNAVDTVSIEIERISEAQRFTTKLFAERASTPALPDKARSAGSTTPH